VQQDSLLKKKLHIPPLRPELVSRPRLLERLNAGLPTRDALSRTQHAFSRALTLVSAPASFGKITLVSEWVNGLRLDAENLSPRSALPIGTSRSSGPICRRLSKVVSYQ
jgi:ATP/maltotriose-dependent transcriptional regulator MalT